MCGGAGVGAGHYVCLCVPCPQRTDEGIRSPGAGDIGGREPWYWEPNLVPLPEQQALIISESSFQLPGMIFEAILQNKRDKFPRARYLVAPYLDILKLRVNVLVRFS